MATEKSLVKLFKYWNTQLQKASKGLRSSKRLETKKKYSRKQTNAFINLCSIGKRLDKVRSKKRKK